MLAQLGPTQGIAVPDVTWRALAPTLILIGGAMLLLVVSALTRRRPARGIYALWTCVVALVAMAASIPLWREVTDASRGLGWRPVVLRGFVAWCANWFLRMAGISGRY